MLAVNPEILGRARETEGTTLQDAAARGGIRDTRGTTGVDRLASATESPDNVLDQRPSSAPRGALGFTAGRRR